MYFVLVAMVQALASLCARVGLVEEMCWSGIRARCEASTKTKLLWGSLTACNVVMQDTCQICAVAFDEVLEATRRVLGPEVQVRSFSFRFVWCATAHGNWCWYYSRDEQGCLQVLSLIHISEPTRPY